MILHKLSASPFSSNVISSCLTIADPTDKIILTQDAVYACQHTDYQQLLSKFSPIYYISDDLEARGITLDSELYQAIDYAEFVALSLICKQVISW